MLSIPASKVILLVDDDPTVRTVIDRMLQIGGFDPVCASSAPEALALLRARPFDLLLTGVMMPGTTGFELAQMALVLRPRLRVILMSGYLHRENTAVHWRLLQKPFSQSQLLASVSATLAA